ncbi:MAG: RNase adapter RapZ [Peptococcaceae bacterium]|jgi:UPF0042 nucleotide-binding protein|nr:RNase adapter RapZ [Peptococcaceae bacterium]MDH7524756.1 RNase adapter RapZ [Peptococcaceae bacterium]
METKNGFAFLIITGLSGAGKTHAIRALEDLGFFCVDNLPPALLPKFAELCLEAKGRIEQIAVVIDARGGRFFDDLFFALEELRKNEYPYEILFLEASTEVLVKRFKETRRRHPLSGQGRLLEDILLERKRLEELRGIANKIIDTSEMTTGQLKTQIVELYGPQNEKVRMNITVMSFGYKYGIPLDADLVIDVRFIPNPFYDPSLSALTGNEEEVKEYVLQSPVTAEFLLKYYELLNFLLPHYLDEGKTHLVIAIGCTGGRHRSVVLANRMGEMLSGSEYRVSVRHRDMPKGAERDPV